MASRGSDGPDPTAHRLTRAAMVGIVTQRRMEGFGLREIADELGIGISQVSALLRSGEQQIQRYNRATALHRHKEIVERYGLLLEALEPGIDASDPASIRAAADILDRVGKAFGAQVIGDHLARQSLLEDEIASTPIEDNDPRPGESIFTGEMLSALVKTAHEAMMRANEARERAMAASQPGTSK